MEFAAQIFNLLIFLFFKVICLVTALVLFPIMFIQELNERGRDKWYFGWSYGTAWGGAIFLAGATLLLVCDRKREEIFYRERLYLHQEDEENVEAIQEAKIKSPR